MKKITGLLICILLLQHFSASAQSFAINTTGAAANGSALLDVSSTTKGLLIPRLTTAQRTSIASPGKGLLVYDSTLKSFYFHDGVNWQQINADSNNLWRKNGNDIYNSNTGNVGIGINSPKSLLNVRGGAVLFDSTIGGTPVSGAGTRMMWIPAKIAFRAGFISGAGNNQWDDVNIGTNSYAMGYNTIASGYSSFSFGNSTTASGSYSFATGLLTVASGLNEPMAMGLQSTATGNFAATAMGYLTHASGDYGATAFGYGTNASGDSGTVAMGYGSTASGKSSLAAGNFARTYGKYSIALGDSAVSNGIASFATGYHTNAGGNYSTAMGNGTNASGLFSTAMGYNTDATYSYCTAMGNSTTANGFNSTAMGTSSTASGSWSTAMGNGTTASGNNSTAMGWGTTASGENSTTMGYATNASGKSSTAMGEWTKSKSYGGFVIGIYNDSTNAANSLAQNSLNRIFQIGNGAWDGARSNAMTVLQSGNVGIGELNPTSPLNFASALGDKIALWGNGSTHYGLGIQPSLLQLYTMDGSNDIAFGYGSSAALTENVRFKGNGNVGIGTTNPTSKLTVVGNAAISSDITVQSGMGIIRNTSGTQLKMQSKAVTVNVSIAAGATTSIALTWPQPFGAGTIEAHVGNITSGGGWAEMIVSVTNVTTTGASLYINNPQSGTLTPNFIVNVIAIGPQ